MQDRRRKSLDRFMRFCLENKVLVVLFVLVATAWGALVAPFDWELGGVPRDPVPVDAIPDVGENQQIVFTEWPGRSPQDVEDQVTYPLTSALLGLPGVSTVRSQSMFGFSSIAIVFEEDIEFYWARSRILEKLNSLPRGTLPDGVQPALGPDATALGQVYWYTLEGRDPEGRPTGGWDLHELRSVQDWFVRYSLMAVDGVSEVASVGGFAQEYQIDVDPDAMRAYGVTLNEIFTAVRRSNTEVGARTIEINRAEYVVRGLGFVRGVEDLERAVVAVRDNVPITVGQIGRVVLGPALRRGALDVGGAEAVGGVVIVRYGENPLAVIRRIEEKVAEIAPGLPRRTLEDGTESQVTVVPFYDRTGLIQETLGTLETALFDEILVSIIVVLVMVAHLQSSLLISGLLPLAVLLSFVAMRYVGVDANVVALSGIAIAIGTMVDMGIVLCENILRHVDDSDEGETRLEAVYRGASEVGGAVLTAVLTTVVSFLPVFTMEAEEGRLFKPLAYTKTFALLASILVALVVIPPLAHLLFRRRRSHKVPLSRRLSFLLAPVVAIFLAGHWQPLGPEREVGNIVFVVAVLGGFLLAFWMLRILYEPILRWCLAYKALFLVAPVLLVVFGATIWLGFDRVFGFLPDSWRRGPLSATAHAFPGLGQEFLPDFDEGSFLFMPTTSNHASIGEAMDVLQKQDRAIGAIPEVKSVVGKIGRVDSALDPAPISMVETVVQYHSEYRTDASGRLLRFAYDDAAGEHVRDEHGQLVPDEDGVPFRQWRDEIRTPRDIWDEIERSAQILGSTSAPELGPIRTRIVMLQTGTKASTAVKVYGPDLKTVERVGVAIERHLRDVPGVNPATVQADRIVAKPYLEIEIDRDAIARHGLRIADVHDVIEVAVGGRTVTTTVEGRERYPVRIRYMRELRDQIETMGRILVPTPGGAQIPLQEVAEIRYRTGPQAIKSEDTNLVGYVTFGVSGGIGEVQAVEACQRYLESMIASGELVIPDGVSYRFTGSYENQVRSSQRLMVVLPFALVIIFMILYLLFRRVSVTLMVFSGVFVAWSGGFLLLWMYGQPWFLDVELFGVDMRELFQVRAYQLTVAVWVGFLALFGIATDDGVIMATYLKQSFQGSEPGSIAEIREATVQAGLRRIRPCLMTSATTVLALIPVLTSTGKGADVMVPMAIPSVGGVAVVLITIFLVPTLYCWTEERRWKRAQRAMNDGSHPSTIAPS